MAGIDLKKELQALYAPAAKTPVIVDVPRLSFIRIDGVKPPGSTPGDDPGFQQATAALYSLSYTLKFMLKQMGGLPDYTVMPLEGLWWTDTTTFDFIDYGAPWYWTLMIMQPDFISAEHFAAALAAARKKADNPALADARFEPFHEGLSVQIMHIGPYSAEMATVERMHAYAHEQGYRLQGKHHEIYLGDPRRTDPARLKTVLRHPVTRS